MDKLPKRKQIRLNDYDYSQNGYYFVTVCIYGRKHLLGNIIEAKTHLNALGEIVKFTWEDLINHNDVILHEYVIMPDHIHGIIEICGRERSATVPQKPHKQIGIPEIMRQFKTFSSKRINEYLKRNGYEPFPTGHLWQKSYYEHIIRDEDDYITRAQYILNNPLNWELKCIDD